MVYSNKRSKHMLFAGLGLALIPIIYHILTLVLMTSKSLSINDIQSTVFYKWIGFEVDSRYAFFYFLLLPIFCCLGLNQIFFEDKKSGFIYQTLFHLSVKKYVTMNIILSFISGFLIAAAPLMIDLWACWTFLPNILPNWMIGSNTTILPNFTYFSTLFYSHPYVLIIFYIILAGLFGGTISVFSLASGLFFKHRIIVISFAFIVFKMIDVAHGYFPQYLFSPMDAVMPYAAFSLPSLGHVLGLFLTMLIFSTIFCVWKVNRIVSN